MVLKVQADDSAEIEVWDVIEAIGYAIFNGARIVNCSFGGTLNSPDEKDAFRLLKDSGILAVCAAGNSCDDMDHGGEKIYPAAYDLENILAVAASDENDNLDSTSNYGSTSVDVMAPGWSIYTTNRDGGYDYLTGTSVAVPHVTGIAALLLSLNPSLDWARLKAVIMDTVDKVPSVADRLVSGGRVNAFRALCRLCEGGLDCDGELNLGDAIIALQLVSGLTPPICPVPLDINGDSAVGPEEAVFILQKLASEEAP
jgi:subtilisin family serine protease